MTPQEITAIISIARRAPLTNMAEAEAVAALLQKLAMEFAPAPPPTPEDTEGKASAGNGAEQ